MLTKKRERERTAQWNAETHTLLHPSENKFSKVLDNCWNSLSAIKRHIQSFSPYLMERRRGKTVFQLSHPSQVAALACDCTYHKWTLFSPTNLLHSSDDDTMKKREGRGQVFIHLKSSATFIGSISRLTSVFLLTQVLQKFLKVRNFESFFYKCFNNENSLQSSSWLRVSHQNYTSYFL